MLKIIAFRSMFACRSHEHFFRHASQLHKTPFALATSVKEMSFELHSYELFLVVANLNGRFILYSLSLDLLLSIQKYL